MCLIQSWRTAWTGTEGLRPSSWNKDLKSLHCGVCNATKIYPLWENTLSDREKQFDEKSIQIEQWKSVITEANSSIIMALFPSFSKSSYAQRACCSHLSSASSWWTLNTAAQNSSKSILLYCSALSWRIECKLVKQKKFHTTRNSVVS